MSKKIDMLEGGLFSKILLFSLPLMASGILQQSFNSVDVAVVGRWCGKEALAAVGSNGMIISLIVNLFIGISIAANVVISRYVGQRDNEGIRRSVATVGVVGMASGLLLAVIGFCAARPMLDFVSTPEDVIDLATTYLRIYFLGMPGLMAYNFGSAILRSLGDTRRPFYALLVGGMVNTGLNLLFVLKLGMDVDGVALATIISQYVSALIIIVFLLREQDPYRLDPRTCRLHGLQFRKMLQIGLPAGMQGVVFSISNVFIVGNINLYGSTASAGSAAALIFEFYCYYVISSFAQAAVVFTSANYGAGNIERCRRVWSVCMLLSVVCSGLLNVVIAGNATVFASIFTQDPDALQYAAVRITTVLLFQFVACSYEISGSAMRGLGYSMTPTVITVIGTCLLRILWVHTVSVRPDDFRLLMSVYPITWTVTGIAVVIAYFYCRRRAFAHISGCA